LEELSDVLKLVSTAGDADVAAAVLLWVSYAGLQVLLVKRRVHRLDPWSGQLACPGGK
jgi:8-oxo-dGTP pyrophosphatase MutT (NUDIX family)